MFLTAKTDDYSVGFGKTTATDYIEKPFEIKNLKEILDKISLPPNLPLNMKDIFDESKKEMKRLKQELFNLETEINGFEKKIDIIIYNQKLIDEKPVLETLFSEIKRIESCHKDIPMISNRSDMAHKEILDSLTSIDDTCDMFFPFP